MALATELFASLDDQAIDAPSMAGRMVQTSILLVKAAAVYWREMNVNERRRYGDFPGYVEIAIRASARHTAWSSYNYRGALDSIIRASVHLARKHGAQ